MSEAQWAEAKFHREHGDPAKAAAFYREVLAADPNHLNAAIGLCRALFYLEDWPAAWEAFDVRFRLMSGPPAATRKRADGEVEKFPAWRSGPPPRRLLVLDEQGLGDTIQFSRFLTRLVEQGVAVQFVTHTRLHRLLAPALPQVKLLSREIPGQARGVDAWCALIDLPRLLNLTAKDFAPRIPYLLVEPDRVQMWRKRLCVPDKLNVGISWQGNPKMPADKKRSAPLSALAPLASVQGVNLISLQMGHGSEDLQKMPFAHKVTVPPADFDRSSQSFLDTAALMTSLDLVISVDTAVVHLAGALGRPVLIALHSPEPDWRWFARPTDSPWYPSARLYRQKMPGEWDEVFLRMAHDIAKAVPKLLAQGHMLSAAE